MNYYIQGDTQKAEQIKAAFEKRGYDISWPGGCAKPDVINIGVERNGAKYVVAETAEYIRDILKTHPDYKELELPVESKFNVGDWVVFNNSHNSIYQISKIRDSFYILLHIYDGSMPLSFSQENLIRPWTIEDAKDGDVLATDNGWTCIFQAFDGCGFSSYCFMDSQKWFCEFGSEVHTPDSRINGKIHPATKEQRDLLFAKMKEAGYEWDADKKELRKIQPHYDIANFKPKQWVLVRDDDEWEWALTRFSHLSNGSASLFVCINGASFQQCIPFEGNEKLLGTSDMPSEQYINW